jgi:hypothetical protein
MAFFPYPMVSRRAGSYPRDFFLHLLAFLALYVCAGSFVFLLFQYVDLLFPDPIVFQTGSLDAIRRSMATLLIIFPVYLAASWLLQRDYGVSPEKAEYRVRKWLLSLTLFAAGIAIIVDLITLLYNFLSGELTPRFLLKVLVVLLTAGTIFGYYLWDFRRKETGPTPLRRTLASSVSAVVAVGILLGFPLAGSPWHQRRVRFDERRVQDLQLLQQEILNYWMQKGRIPSTLQDLEDSISGFLPPQDPATGAPYEYRPISRRSFELCATFVTASRPPDEGQPKPVPPYEPSVGPYQQNWAHDAERTCFSRSIDPERYRREPERLKVP